MLYFPTINVYCLYISVSTTQSLIVYPYCLRICFKKSCFIKKSFKISKTGNRRRSKKIKRSDKINILINQWFDNKNTVWSPAVFSETKLWWINFIFIYIQEAIMYYRIENFAQTIHQRDPSVIHGVKLVPTFKNRNNIWLIPFIWVYWSI